MHYAVRYLPGANTPSLFSKYWENEPDDPLLFSKRGHLFGYLTLRANNSPNDLSQTASLLISQINQLYFNLDGSLFPDRLKLCLDQIQKSWSSGHILSITLWAINEDTLAISSFGDSVFYLRRQSSYSQLINSTSSGINLVTGPIQHQDLIFVSHPDLVSQIGDINQFFAIPSLDHQEEFLKNQFGQTSYASVLVEVSQDPSPVPSFPPVLSEPPPLVSSSSRSLAFKLPPLKKLITKIFTPKPISVSTHPFKHVETKNRRNLILGALATIGLFSSLFIGYTKNRQNQKLEKFNQLEAQVQADLDSIDKVRQLNLEDAQIHAQKTKQLIDQMASLGLNQTLVNTYQDKITSILSQTGSAEHTKLDQFYDTSLIVDNPSYSHLIFADSKIFLLDSQKGRIDSISGKSNQSVSTDPLAKDTTSIVFFRSNLYALAKDGLYQVTKKNWTKTLSLGDTKPISIFSWGSSIYYLFDQSITRSSLVNNVLADPVAWLATDQKLPDSPSSLAIDSKVWVLSKNGLISVYLRGKKDVFSLNQPPQTSSASYLQIAQDKDILAFLADSKTLMVYTKAGVLVSKYNLKDYDIKAIALDEAGSNLYLLASDQKIYQLKL